MSDLGPFVAAVLRDQVVHEQQEEIGRLRDEVQELKDAKQRLEDRHQLLLGMPPTPPPQPRSIPMDSWRLIEWTGTNRLPVYRESRLRHGDIVVTSVMASVPHPRDNGPQQQQLNSGAWVDLFSGDMDLCLCLRELYLSELWWDDELILSFREAEWTSLDYFRCTFTENRFVYLRISKTDRNNNILGWLFHAYLGPVTEAQYMQLTQLRDLSTMVAGSAITRNDTEYSTDVYDSMERTVTIANIVQDPILASLPVKIVFDEGLCRATAAALL